MITKDHNNNRINFSIDSLDEMLKAKMKTKRVIESSKTNKQLDSSKRLVGLYLDSTEDLIGASAGCISLSVIETDPKEIHKLIENLDTEKIDGHYGIKDYLPNHQDNISGFLKYKSHDSLSEQEDIINCLLVKNIVTNISWNCIVYKNFSKKNLGLKKRIVSGLNWVFSKTKSAIILEDDCLPNRDFFTFCQKLLIYYEKNNTVRFITGNNFQKSKHNKKTSYYFSKYSHIWGWATWKNTWELYCDDNRVWKKYLSSKEFSKICPNYLERRYWRSMFDKVKSGKLKSWSIYLLFSIWKNSGLTATPSVNLVKNLGFNERGTNTKISTIKYNTKNLTLSKKLIHPKKIFQNLMNGIIKKH